MNQAYRLAQSALADLKAAVHLVLTDSPPEGLTNAELGRALGIYGGHVGHMGHISRTLLAMLETEGVAEQDQESKRWRLKPLVAIETADSGAQSQNAEAVIEGADDLTAAEVVHRRVRCPACQEKVFERWPDGWDAHAAHRCQGLAAATEGGRKAEFRERYSHLFR